jgi:hypothetical protein
MIVWKEVITLVTWMLIGYVIGKVVEGFRKK